MEQTIALLEKYGYSIREYPHLRYRVWGSEDLWVYSGGYVLGKLVEGTHYLAGATHYRPVSRKYWLESMRNWAQYVKGNEK